MTVNYAIRESEGKSFRWGQPVLVGQLSLNVSSLRFSVEAKNLRAKYGSEGSLSEFSAGRNYSNAATPQKPTKKKYWLYYALSDKRISTYMQGSVIAFS